MAALSGRSIAARISIFNSIVATAPRRPLFVYIEGDGAAYLDPHTPSSDPTPIEPLALRLAVADQGPAAAYVARPCQFAPGRGDPRCTTTDWTNRRFSSEAVEAVSDASMRARRRGRWCSSAILAAV